jgi:hypothetical protein
VQHGKSCKPCTQRVVFIFGETSAPCHSPSLWIAWGCSGRGQPGRAIVTQLVWVGGSISSISRATNTNRSSSQSHFFSSPNPRTASKCTRCLQSSPLGSSVTVDSTASGASTLLKLP